jgi:ribosome-associated protein
LNSLEIAALVAYTAGEKKASNIVVLDFRENSILYDFCIVASAETRVQTKAIARAIDERVKGLKPPKRQVQGMPFGNWILLDYGTVVANIFMDWERSFYDLEGFWKTVPRLSPDSLGEVDITPYLRQEIVTSEADQ